MFSISNSLLPMSLSSVVRAAGLFLAPPQVCAGAAAASPAGADCAAQSEVSVWAAQSSVTWKAGAAAVGAAAGAAAGAGAPSADQSVTGAAAPASSSPPHSSLAGGATKSACLLAITSSALA